MTATPRLRRATTADGDAVADVWLASWRATFDFEPGHPDDAVRRWLTTELLPATEAWVAVDVDDRPVAVMALSETMVEQLYVDPGWIGRGVGHRLLRVAMARRPAGLDLYCFQVNGRARAFYEAHGFEAVAFGDGTGNEEGQPDIRYAWRPDPVAPPDLVATSRDGTPIAAFRSGDPAGRPLLLVHGASADHTTFRVLGPRLAGAFDLYAVDRRGRGASGDTAPYAIDREFEDVAAIAAVVADARGTDVDAFGHSYGGRCVLGAALGSAAMRRVISYEGAPTPPGERYGDAGLDEELAALHDAGLDERLLETFMTRVVAMSTEDLDRYRADPVWPVRVAAAGTIARELRTEASEAAGLDRLAAVRQPVLQLLGGDSVPAFSAATWALDARLVDGRVVVIPGARHAAHHSHADAVVDAVTAFLQPGM